MQMACNGYLSDADHPPVAGIAHVIEEDAADVIPEENPPLAGVAHEIDEDAADVIQEVNPPVAGIAHVFNEDDENVLPEPIQNPNCVRCLQYLAQEDLERAISPGNFNLTMFRLKCWSKDLYDILHDIQEDKIPEGDGGMKNYVYSINHALTLFFDSYR